MINQIRNIGIFAHVDAGKTTLTEQILLKTCTIRTAGRVDNGTAHTDSLSVERQRGISVRSGSVCVRFHNTDIHIIDTPGHVDFSSEVETALLAVDGAVLVVSAVEGVQAQTAAISHVLSMLRIPMVAFVNKIDRIGADVPHVLNELRLHVPQPVLMEQSDDILIDELSVCDDKLLELAVQGTADKSSIDASAACSCRALKITPVYTGAALKGIGVDALLNAIVEILPPPTDAGRLSAAAYHVRQENAERKVRLRVFGGQLTIGPVEGYGRIQRLRIQTPKGEKTVKSLNAGEIGVAVGMEGFRAGMWLGTRVRGSVSMSAPVMRAQVVPENENDLPALLAALERMHDETANLNPSFEPRSRRVHIHTMGEVQQQILEQILLNEHDVRASLMPPEVLFRETPAKAGCGSFDKMMDPWKARASFRVEPGPRGSGICFISETHVDNLHVKYQKDIEKSVRLALQEGLTGWPVTDIVVTLTSGQGSWLSWGGASSHFGPVVPLGLFAALKDAGAQMLEPFYSFEAKVGEGALSILYYELRSNRAQCEPFVYDNGSVIVKGIIPVETSHQFASRINELSHGRGFWRTAFEGYFPAPEGVGRAIARTTPDPTNPSLYMDYIVGRL